MKKYIKSIFYIYKLRQEALLRKALREEGINDNRLKIEIDHLNGFNYINSKKFNIIYPRSFIKKINHLTQKFTEKKYDFYFNGYVENGTLRQEFLTNFQTKNSLIIKSQQGRSKYGKAAFNKNYYIGLIQSNFSLCPNQDDYVIEAKKENLWTYRFIESCFAKSFPILVKELPHGKNFVKNFNFEVLSCESCIQDINYTKEMIESNFRKAVKKHTFIYSSLDYLKGLK